MTILRINDPCPQCEQGILRATYEPYEFRCDHCKSWLNRLTGKQIDPLTTEFHPAELVWREGETP